MNTIAIDKNCPLTVKPASGKDVMTILHDGVRFWVSTKAGAWYHPTDFPETPQCEALSDGHEVCFHNREITEKDLIMAATHTKPTGRRKRRTAERMMDELMRFMREQPMQCVTMLHRIATLNGVRGTAKKLRCSKSLVIKNSMKAAIRFPALRKILRVKQQQRA